MSDHIASSETSPAQLDDAGQSLNEVMQLSILFSSVKTDKDCEAVIAAVRKLRNSSTTWEKLSVRAIDNYKENASGSETDRHQQCI